jgi:integrase
LDFGTDTTEFCHLGVHVSEVYHRYSLEMASREVVQEMLGHANIRQTMDTYSHVLPNMQQQAAERMDQMLG